MKQTMSTLEQVSALADGQLPDEDVTSAVASACESAEARAAWQRYHLIGDVLRTGRHEACTDTSAFVARFQKRLEAERPVIAVATAVPAALEVRTVRAEAANEPVFRWKLIAGAASLAAAAAIGWNWVGNGVPASTGPQLAQVQRSDSVLAALPTPSAAPATTTVAIGNGASNGSGPPQAMIRDARLDEMLAAHRQAAGGSQMPSGFLRNATFEGPAR